MKCSEVDLKQITYTHVQILYHLLFYIVYTLLKYIYEHSHIYCYLTTFFVFVV